MKIAVASDHAGFEQLGALADWLRGQGHEILNFGPATFQPDDDYPDFIFGAAQALSSGQVERAIVLGASGQGEAMAANRFKGVRCAIYYGVAVPRGVVDAGGRVSHDPHEIIRLSRLHNDANAISLAARFVSLEEMKQVIRLWLETPFSDEQRHSRRIKKLDGDI
jgi:ribose 5-phosphate isomerase B